MIGHGVSSSITELEKTTNQIVITESEKILNCKVVTDFGSDFWPEHKY
jgi:hypothetical protein